MRWLWTICAVAFIACTSPHAAALAGSPDEGQSNYELFEAMAVSSHLHRRHRDAALAVLAASGHFRAIAMSLLADDDARRVRLACAVLGSAPSTAAYDALLSLASDETRPLQIRRIAANSAIGMAGGGLTFFAPDLGEDSIEADLRWLEGHPPYTGPEHFERLRNELANARAQFRNAIARDDESNNTLQPPFNAIGFISNDLGLGRLPTDRDAFSLLVEHCREMLDLPPSTPAIEGVLTCLTQWIMQQFWCHACMDPAWLHAVRDARSRDELMVLLADVDPGLNPHDPQRRVVACVDGLQSLGFEVGREQTPAENLSALHEAVRSPDARAAFFASEVLQVLGVISYPLPPAAEVAPAVMAAWRGVVLQQSTRRFADSGLAPGWDERRQAWSLMSARLQVHRSGS